VGNNARTLERGKMRIFILAVAFLIGMSGTGLAHTTGHTTTTPAPVPTPPPEYIKIEGPTAGGIPPKHIYVRKTDIVELKVLWDGSADAFRVEMYVAKTTWREGPDRLRTTGVKVTELQPILVRTFATNNPDVIPAALTTFVESIIPASNVLTVH